MSKIILKNKKNIINIYFNIKNYLKNNNYLEYNGFNRFVFKYEKGEVPSLSIHVD